MGGWTDQPTQCHIVTLVARKLTYDNLLRVNLISKHMRTRNCKDIGIISKWWMPTSRTQKFGWYSETQNSFRKLSFLKTATYLKSDYRIGFTMKRRYKLSIQLICFDCFNGLGDAEEVVIQKCSEFWGKLPIWKSCFFCPKRWNFAFYAHWGRL